MPGRPTQPEAQRPARPVVITRPLAQAAPLQRKVAAIGRLAVLLPLLEIHPLEDNRLLDAAVMRLEQYALVAFVSPNAIDAALARRQPWPLSVPLAVMGEGSRLALAAHGVTAATTRIFSPADRERTDSQTLLATLDLPALTGKKVLILRGESGRELLADALRDAGVDVEQVAAYRRCAPIRGADSDRRLQHLLDTGCDWIITSSEALRILVDMAAAAGDFGGNGDGVAKLQQQTLFVPHARIAETAHALGFRNVIRTASGDESLLAALQFRHE